MTWTLQAISPELDGQEIIIDRDMLVGRHQAADIVLQSAEISRKHAGFSLIENALWLQDLSSSNGTFINEKRISEQVQLQNGDLVHFASLQFTVLQKAMAQAIEEQTPAQQMNEQGMPELKERDTSIQLTRDGMPTNVGIPKPAPIPEGVDVSAVTPEPTPVPVEQPVSRVEEAQQEQANTKVGLIAVITIIIIAILAFVLFK